NFTYFAHVYSFFSQLEIGDGRLPQSPRSSFRSPLSRQVGTAHNPVQSPTTPADLARRIVQQQCGRRPRDRRPDQTSCLQPSQPRLAPHLTSIAPGVPVQETVLVVQCHHY